MNCCSNCVYVCDSSSSIAVIDDLKRRDHVWRTPASIRTMKTTVDTRLTTFVDIHSENIILLLSPFYGQQIRSPTQTRLFKYQAYRAIKLTLVQMAACRMNGTRIERVFNAMMP